MKTSPQTFFFLAALIISISLFSACAPQTQVWSGNGKSYRVTTINGKRYLDIPPVEYLLQKRVPVPAAPTMDGVSIVVSLSNQRAWLYKDGTLFTMSVCCPGKPGHETPTGKFRVIDKEDKWVSTLYHCPMPHFLRLNTPGGDIGLHEGCIFAAPASHGCIRLPEDKAAEFFKIASVGSEVVINP